jgi:xanthine dehydrogenase accessory factor
VAIVTKLARERRGFVFDGRLVVHADGRVTGSFGDAAGDARARDAGLDQIRHGTPRLVAIDDQHDLLVEPVTSRPQIVIAGGGHVSKAIARQARLLDFDVTVLEDRLEFADPDRFDGAAVLGGDLAANIASLDYGPQTYLVIATRGHKLDSDCIVAAVKTNARYIGLLGSRRKTVLIEQMLREIGVDASRAAAIHAPVGLDLGGRTPEEIALSVLAEITQLRDGGSGRPLRER